MSLLDKTDLTFYLLMLLCVYVFVKGRRLHNGDWLNPLRTTVFLPIGVLQLFHT
jgi:hypothetical protein